MNKIEFSKKIVILSGSIFVITVIACIVIFTLCTINNISFDWTGIVTLLTTTGAAFTACIAAYEGKAKIENVYKIKKSFLQEKYKILNDIGILKEDYASQEIVNEVQNIDEKLNTEESNAISENDVNFNINL